MRLHLQTTLHVPPSATGFAFPNTIVTAGDADKIKLDCLRAIDEACAAGLFDANGCLTLLVQASRTTK